ncbi:Porin subfamily protein [Planctomycetes bacterium Poly30]|uniref:Porin subfamily protein n=1 Tax=Saltatorellus ferox TaxID=2528018 RepID=A0A518EYX0_9BACT|nr:Porin subfamily protein [Planctomycetes bacterium Poly30]
MLYPTAVTLLSFSATTLSSTGAAFSATQQQGAATSSIEDLKGLALEIEEARPIADGTKFTYGGYVQLDAVSSDYSGGKPANQLIDDFLVPSLIPVEPTSGADNYRSTNMHSKSSRFFLKTATETEMGKIASHIELDFILSGQGDERISNSWSGRIRHAFVKWEPEENRSIMVGQNWSTFFNVSALPDHLDFVGPVGTVFMRQPQLRYTADGLELALENSATRVTGATYDNDSEGIPDVIARYNRQDGDLSWSLAGMLRELSYEDRSNPVIRGAHDAKYGYAASLAGKWKMGQDDLRFMVSYGDALGRYLGLNAFNDGYIDGGGQIQTIDQLGAFAAYRHVWDPAWHSTFSYSFAEAENPGVGAFASTGDLASAYQSVHASLNYVPAPRLRFGVELIWAEKELEDGRSGEVSRFQFSVQHAF